MLSNEELSKFSKISVWPSLYYLIADYLLIGLCFYLVSAHGNPFVYIFSFILIARTQLALAILMHDASHRRLAQSRPINDFIGQFLIAAPLFFSMFSYQRFHLKHHRIPMQDDDPDISLTGGYPISKKSFLRKIFRDLSGVSYFKFIGYFIYKSRKKNDKTKKTFEEHSKLESYSRLTIALSILISNLVLISILYLLGNPWLYLFFWFLPMVTMLQFLLRIRGITEHAGYKGIDSKKLEDQAHISRTLVNPLQTFFFAPHSVNYHIEHHIYPGIPHYRLKKVHRLLKERKSLPEKNLYQGYGQVLKELIN